MVVMKELKDIIRDADSDYYRRLSDYLREMWNKTSIALESAGRSPLTLGELVADIKIVYDYYKQMGKVGDRLVKKYGPGQGDGIDDYYHPLLQCQLAKISPMSADWVIRLGYGKEIWDYYRKKNKKPMSEITADSQKDLKNNIYGNIMGAYSGNIPCWRLLDGFRTENMRKENIWY